MTPTELWESGREMAICMASKYVSKLPSRYRLEDFEQTALLGLWQAALSYKKDCDVKFTSFAYKHVLGAMNREWWRHAVFGYKTVLTKRGNLRFLDLPPDLSYVDDTRDVVENQEFVQSMFLKIKDERVRDMTRKHYLEEVSLQDIGSEVNLHKSNVRIHINKGYQELSERIRQSLSA